MCIFVVITTIYLYVPYKFMWRDRSAHSTNLLHQCSSARRHIKTATVRWPDNYCHNTGYTYIIVVWNLRIQYLGAPSIHNIMDVGDSERGLCNIGCNNNQPCSIWRCFKYSPLQSDRSQTNPRSIPTQSSVMYSENRLDTLRHTLKIIHEKLNRYQFYE